MPLARCLSGKTPSGENPAPRKTGTLRAMRIVSHTCSNTEIVCALGAQACLVGVDSDSDYPPDVVQRLPQLGRDLQLDIAAVMALEPDLVLSSLTVPGHEVIVDALRQHGVRLHVSDPESLEDIYADIGAIGSLLQREAQASQLVAQTRAAIPARTRRVRPRVAVEWWPKPAILAARKSWVYDLVQLAGGELVGAEHPQRSLSVSIGQPPPKTTDLVVMSWCGVSVEKYRARQVLQRIGWTEQPAIREQQVWPVSEAYLGRPGPRLVQGYQQLVQRLDAWESAQSAT